MTPNEQSTIETAQTTVEPSSFVPNNDEYLTHYWPFCNGEMKDKIGSADMIQGNLTSFVSDRFGNQNSALALNGGWAQVPQGIYFDTSEFTISVWILPQKINEDDARVIDFGNDAYLDNILIKLLNTSNDWKPSLNIYNGTLDLGTVQSDRDLVDLEWQLLTVTFDGVQMVLYINGTKAGNFTLSPRFPPQSLIRANNYIGKSNDPSTGFSSSYLDDLRFYNKCLNQQEILDLVNNNRNYSSEQIYPFLNNFFITFVIKSI